MGSIYIRKRNKSNLKSRIPKFFLVLLFLLSIQINNGTTDIYSWYNSGWGFRREVTVSNSGGTLSNVDVLVELNTQTLISNSKLQSNCNDLRFIDSDDSTVLTYWIESGCNTTATQIWVRIPSLPSGGKTIYVYYGNSSASQGQLNWSGTFIGLSDSSCPSGWTRITSYDNRYPRGSTTYGSTGGASTHSHTYSSNFAHTHTKNTLAIVAVSGHTHQIYRTGSPSGAGIYVYGGDTAGTYYNTAIQNTGAHSHSYGSGTSSTVGSSSASTNTADNLPPYLNLLFCSLTTSEFSSLPTGLIYMFESIPGTYSDFTTLNSRFPRSSSTAGSTGGSSTHTHPYSTIISHSHTATISTTSDGDHRHSLRSNEYVTGTLPYVRMEQTPRATTSGAFASVSHSHSLTGTSGTTGGTSLSTDSANSLPSRLQVKFGKQTEERGTYLSSTIVMTTSLPPLGWTRLSSLDNAFPYGGTYGTGASVSTHRHTLPNVPSHSHTAGTLATNSVSHSHSVTYGQAGATSPYPVGTATAGPLSTFDMASSGGHGHTLTASLNSSGSNPAYTAYESEVPLYFTVVFSQKNISMSTSVGLEEANTLPPSEPTNLLINNQSNPIKVSTSQPYFSAIFNDPDTGDTGNWYQIEVNTDSTFTGTVMWDSGLQSMTPTTNGSRSPNITYYGTTLPLDANTYYWRIRFADNMGSVGDWSYPNSSDSFTMAGPPFAPSSLLTEGATNPTGVTDLTPEFSAVHTDPNQDSAASYEIHVNTASNFSGTSMWESTKTSLTVAHNARSADISYNGTTLSYNGTTYYWRIRFWDSDDTVGEWSSAAQFTMYTNQTPNAPSSLLTQGSADPIKVSSTTPYFSAIFSDNDTGDTGEYYEIHVNTASDFTGTVMWESTKTSITSIANGARSSNITYTPTNLALDGTTYYWRIKFWDNYDYASNWSSAQFTMSGPPSAPSSLQTNGLTNPHYIYNAFPVFSAIHFDVNQDSASAYEIHVNTNSSFTGTVMWNSGKVLTTVNHNQRSPNYTYDGTTLNLDSTTYYWRIRFWDIDDNVSDWSATAQFTDLVNNQYFKGLMMKGLQLN